MLRVGAGLEDNCHHSFDCPNCGTPLTINLRSKAPAAWVQTEENTKIIPQVEQPDFIINLHPSCAFNSSDFHAERIFASLAYIQAIVPYMRQRPGKHQDAALQFEVPNTAIIWQTVKNLISLDLNGDPKGLIQKHFHTYKNARTKYTPYLEFSDHKEAITKFFDDIFYPKIGSLLSNALTFTQSAKSQHTEEFERFASWYKSEMQTEAVGRYSALFSDYFRCFDQFRQILYFSRVSKDEVDDLVVGSKRFDEIKLYYGQAYETLTSQYILLACINNISAGRKFDEFKSMSLNKYIKDVEKAKRSNPFSDVPELYAFAEFENSSLRNGSHHASIWKDGEKVMFRSGGTGAENNMPYARYLHLCNGITIANAALFLLEYSMVFERIGGQG